MPTRIALIMLLVLIVPPSRASAQNETPATLRQRITQLERENETLRARIDELAARLDELQGENRALRRSLLEASRGTPEAGTPSPEQTEPGETAAPVQPVPGGGREPLSSPDSLFVALVLDHAETISQIDGQDQEAIRKRVQDWTRSARRRFSGQTEWLLRLEPIEMVETDRAEPPRKLAMATVLDPATQDALSIPFPIEVPDRFHARLVGPRQGPSDGQGDGQGGGRGGEKSLWISRVQMEAKPVFEPERAEAGPFNYPPFIGPYAGFGCTVQMLSLSAITPEEARLRAPPVQPDPEKAPVDR